MTWATTVAPNWLSLWYNETALKIPRAVAPARALGAGRTQGPRAATREVTDDRFPTHRPYNRCCRRRSNHRAAGIRASAAGSRPASLAGRPQDRILREGQRPHPLRRNRLGLPAAGEYTGPVAVD